jgi:hypothetical protein
MCEMLADSGKKNVHSLLPNLQARLVMPSAGQKEFARIMQKMAEFDLKPYASIYPA